MRRMTRLVALAMILTGLPVVPALAAPEPGGGRTEVLTRVIVTLDEDVLRPEVAAMRAAEAVGGRVEHVYRHALKGFSMELPEAALSALERRPGVARVERDIEVRVAAQPVPTGVDRIDGDVNPGAGNFSDVDVAVLDTGVWFDTTPSGAVSHEDLNLIRVSDCTGAIFYPLFGGCQGGGNDGNGHGTHVAGIIGGCDNEIGTLGTAPCAKIWSIKILGDDGSGTGGGLLAGVDLVTANAADIEVANMSFTLSEPLAAFETAVGNAVAAGVVFVGAAGNDGIDAANVPPANIPAVIAVSSVTDYDGLPAGLGAPTCRTDTDDTLASYSNFGQVIDIAAPGSCIYSTYLNNGYATFSGTSMASPAVAGAAARYISESGSKPGNTADVEAVRDALVAGGAPQAGPCGFTGDADGFAEPLLFLNGSAFGGDGTCGGDPPDNQPPVAAFTASCVDLSCSFDASGTQDEDPGSVTYAWTFGDGSAGAGVSTSHTYGAAGGYTVTLTVTDAEGLTDSTSQQVNPTDPVVNQPPVASFTASCVDLSCSFDASATQDEDPGSVTYAWTFGDGSAGAGVTASHTYGAAGGYTVTLTATDAEGLTDSTSQQVNPTDPTGEVTMTVGVAGFLVVDRDATVEFFVIDTNLDGVAGAAVVGEWAYLDRRGRTRIKEVAATSDATGLVSITTRFPPGSTVTSFCVTDVTKTGYVYEPGLFTCGGPL